MTQFITPPDGRDIEVIEPILVTNNNSKMEAVAEKTPVDISQLSAEQRKELLKQLAEDEKQAKVKKEQDRETYKKLVLETTPKALFRLAQASELMSNAKKETFQFFEDILQLKADAFGIKEGQQSHTFTSPTAEITIGFRVNDGWDDTVHAGVEKVTKFLTSLANNDETAVLVETVFNLLKKDAKGNLKGSRVIELDNMKTKFNNEEFSDGVSIIKKAYKPVRSSWFIEAYNVNPDDGTKTNIPLSMSSVEFPGGYTFDFFNTKPETDESTNH